MNMKSLTGVLGLKTQDKTPLNAKMKDNENMCGMYLCFSKRRVYQVNDHLQQMVIPLKLA